MLSDDCIVRNIPGTDIVKQYVLYLANGNGVLAMHNSILNDLGINTDDFIKNADKNAAKIYPITFTEIGEVYMNPKSGGVDINSITEISEDGIYVLQYDGGKKNYGACTLFDETVQQKIFKIVGGNYVIVPDSKNDVLIIKDSKKVSIEALQDLLQSVNESFLGPALEEKLSDYILEYSKERGLVQNIPESPKKHHGR